MSFLARTAHQRYEERHDIYRLNAVGSHYTISDRLSIEHSSGEQKENGDEGDGNEVQMNMPSLEWSAAIARNDP